MNNVGNVISGLFNLLFTTACVLCFGACGVLYILYDTCPLIERVGTVGIILLMLLFSHAFISALISASQDGDEDEEVEDETSN